MTRVSNLSLTSLHVFLLISLLIPSLADAQTLRWKIAFTNGAILPSFTRYKPSALSSGVSLSTGPASVPIAFRSHASKRSGFTYTVNSGPGVFIVKLAFLEYSNAGCRSGARVFTFSANTKTTPHIDVFDRVGCNKKLFVRMGNVQAENGKIVVTARRVSGLAPFVSFIVILDQATPPGTGGGGGGGSSGGGGNSGSGGGNSGSGGGNSGGGGSGSGPPPGTSLLKISFPKFGIAPGWTKYTEAGLSAGTIFGSTGDVTIQKAYRTHVKNAAGFSYVHQGVAPGVYNVKLGFLEFSVFACTDNKRVFKANVNGKVTTSIDVYKEVGCQKILLRTVNNVVVTGNGRLTITLVSMSSFAPMLSTIQTTPGTGGNTGSPPTTSAPSSTNAGSSTSPPPSGPSNPSGGAVTEVELDLASPTEVGVPGSRKTFSSLPVTANGFAPPSYYRHARLGSDFTYSFNLSPGAYDITLGFAETYSPNFCSEGGKRVFNVYINDMLKLEGYDIYESVGCLTADEITFEGETVGAVNTKPLKIRFYSIANFAVVSYIRITKAKNGCVPASMSGELASDHAAHSVPGSYPPVLNAQSARSYVDSDGDGFVTVLIDGGGSHSHFFDSANNIIGTITDYTWSIVETGKIVSKKRSFSYKFPLGTTRLRLVVVDNSCTTDEAETPVTVTGTSQPGQYCYYYNGLTELPVGGALFGNIRPQFAAISASVNLGFPSFPFANSLFAVRCKFFLQVDQNSRASEISIQTGGTGIARVYKGEDLIIDSATSNSADTALSVGLTAFEVVYLRTTLTGTPVLKFNVDGATPGPGRITHDRTMVLPILTSVSPNDGPIGGGTRVKVSGYGLFQPLSVSFGGKNVNVVNSGATQNQFFIDSPAVSSAKVAKITVKTSNGLVSNPVNFEYGSTCDSVNFDETALLQPSGKVVNFLELPTCATMGHDGKIYMGTLGGTVQVLGYDVDSLTTISHCYSKAVVDLNFKINGIPSARDILGITFDPRDKQLRPYISTSTNSWRESMKIDASNLGAWRNGGVDRMKPGTDPTDSKVCLVYDKGIVSGLPVSNHDHAINGLMFTQGGDLLIAVGGFTNMGLPGYKLGGLWETQLSAAVLIAKLSKPGFNGKVTYNNPNVPRHATKKSGDVDLFATGLRNTFAMTMTGSGDMYASDQGPNCNFGDTASSCSDYVEADAAAWDTSAQVDWKGKVRHGWVACPYSLGRPDKMIHLTQGSWYGHPNIQRGGNECAWIDPFDDLTADDKPAPASYTPPMVTLKSSVTGMSEYRSDHFCGKLRGELILSSYKSGATYRMGVNGGKTTSGPDEISPTGGITFVENAYGDLIFPRLNEKNVFVMRPRVSPKADLFIAGAVPFRHGKAGGTKIRIGGYNFGALPKVKIGNQNCNVLSSSDREIVCLVPPGSGSKSVQVTTASGESQELPGAVLYMGV